MATKWHIIVLFTFLCTLALVAAKGRVMPWMCLEICGFSKSQIQTQLLQLKNYSNSLSGVSYEAYSLGSGSTFNNLQQSNVQSEIASYGLETWPMIVNSDINEIRQLLANPTPFVTAAINTAKQLKFTGYNIDFEPASNATTEDAVNYAKFLTQFANELHAIGFKLSADVATWSYFWNLPLLSNTTIDKLMYMETYVTNQTLWVSEFQTGTSQITNNKLGVGLECNLFVPQNDLEIRFQYIAQASITEIDIWETPIPANWWPFIEQFASSK